MSLLAAGAYAAPALTWTEAAPRDQIVLDWLQQDQAPAACFADGVGHAAARAAVEKALGGVPATEIEALRQELQGLAAVPGSDPRWRELYIRACTARREARLRRGLESARSFVYTRHYTLGGSHYAYTEGESDAQAERHFVPGAALCLLKLDGPFAETATVLDAPQGVIRDPDVDYDGQHVLFAWKKSDREDDYHLYELDLATGQVRQITDGLGFADYEGCYLPDGQIAFNSTRCVQIVDCWWTEVSNLHVCNRDGRALRRLGYDQVHTNFPQVLNDGRLVYTRWDYNDRGQIFPQALFAMNPDGTGQTAFYGNNSWFPTTLIHARPIPGSDQVIAIATGHHSDQSGKLVLVDRTRGQEENEGIQLIAPRRDTPAVHVDAYGQDGEQFGTPYPLNDREFIVSYAPANETREGVFVRGHFGIYWMDVDGNRELLAWDANLPCNQPVAVAARPRPSLRPYGVDYRQDLATVFLQDIYAGGGLKGVARGTIKRLRVVSLDFRAAGIRSNGNAGPAGGAMVSTPVAIGNGAWDVKIVHGDADVHPDGSALFTVPARLPVYFQALDARGRMVQTMRSWATPMPGERLSCVGCHEPKPATPRQARPTALTMPPQALRPFYGPPRGFSFIREVQPILDRHCITCHADRSRPRPGSEMIITQERLAKATPLHAPGMPWQYTTDKPGADWTKPEFDSSQWQSGAPGFGTAGTPGIDVKTTWNTPDIWLRASFKLDRDLTGHQVVAMTYNDEDVEIYVNGVRAAEATGYVVAPHPLPVKQAAFATLKPGENHLAVHCHQTIGGQGVAVTLLDLGPGPDAGDAAAAMRPLQFSLLGTQTPDNGSGRMWSDAYLALTNAYVGPGEGSINGHPTALTNWIGAQTAPPMLPPYYAGATQSRLLEMLDAGHHSVKLTVEETEKLAAWLDLNVPYCGDYTEANCWTDAERAKYARFADKRRQSDDLERRGVAEWLALH